MKDSSTTAGCGTTFVSNRKVALTTKDAPPAVNIVQGAAFVADAVPLELRNAPRWTAWRRVWNEGKWHKPACAWQSGEGRYKTGYSHNRDAATLVDLPAVIQRADEAFDRDSLGVSFVTGDGWVALDFDNIDPDALPPLLADHMASGRGFWCRSVSGHGVRIIGRAARGIANQSTSLPTDVSAAALGVDGAAVEFKANGAPATVTTHRVLRQADAGWDISSLWDALLAMLPAKPAVAPQTAPASMFATRYDDLSPDERNEVVRRCQRSVSKRAEAVSGNGGNAALMGTLSYIANRWGLANDAGEAIAREYNQRCQPPFSESDFTRSWANACAKAAASATPPATLLEAVERMRNRNNNSRPRSKAGQKEPAAPPRERVPVSIDGNNDAEIRARIVNIVGSDPTGMPAIFEREDDPYPRAVHVAIKSLDCGARFPVILPASNAHVREAVTRCISFTQRTPHGVREVVAKDRHLEMVREIPQGLPKLRRVLHGPSYDAATDTVLNTAGYDRETGYLLAQASRLSVPDRVTHADAQAAAKELVHAFRYVRFQENETGADIYRARYLVELMTVMLRHNFTSTPAFMHTANAPGNAKTYLARAASLICHGREAAVQSIPSGRDAETELEKRIVTVASEGQPIALFDNIERGTELASKVLEALTTSGAIQGRAMRESRTIGGQYRFSLIFTGNNIQPDRDMAQRVLSIRLEGSTDGRKRQLSSFGDQGDLIEYLKRADVQRRLLTALITIARGYQQAGRPAQPGEAWNSFTDWLRQCVDPIRWALGVDPLHNQEQEWKEDDRESQVIHNLLEAIINSDVAKGGRPFTTAELFDAGAPGSMLANLIEDACNYLSVTPGDKKGFTKRVLSAYSCYPVCVGDATWKLQKAGSNRQGTALFRLTPIKQAKNSRPEEGCGYSHVFAGTIGNEAERDVVAQRHYQTHQQIPANTSSTATETVEAATQSSQIAQSDAISLGLPDGLPPDAATLTAQQPPSGAVLPAAVFTPPAPGVSACDQLRQHVLEQMNKRVSGKKLPSADSGESV